MSGCMYVKRNNHFLLHLSITIAAIKFLSILHMAAQARLTRDKNSVTKIEWQYDLSVYPIEVYNNTLYFKIKQNYLSLLNRYQF